MSHSPRASSPRASSPRASSPSASRDSNQVISPRKTSPTETTYKISVETKSGAVLDLHVKDTHMAMSVIRILKETFPSHHFGSRLALRMSKSSTENLDYRMTMAEIRQQSDYPENGTLYLFTPPSFLEAMYSSCVSFLSSASSDATAVNSSSSTDSLLLLDSDPSSSSSLISSAVELRPRLSGADPFRNRNRPDDHHS